jgi:hypothetical protein
MSTAPAVWFALGFMVAVFLGYCFLAWLFKDEVKHRSRP